MRAISLWQPWASLIFTGDKLHETRSWRPPDKLIGQRIAIHAAKSLPKEIDPPLHVLCEREWGGLSRWREEVPRGCIVGSAVLAHWITTNGALAATPMDRIAGDWSEGRFAWRLIEPRRLPDPIPWKGRQGWFDVPDDVMEVSILPK